MNWRSLHLAAQLAQAAYFDTLVEATPVFNSLGHRVVGHYTDDDHNAFLLLGPDGYTVAISGTRFGRSVADVVDDINILGVDLGDDGARVARGPYGGMAGLWLWALQLAPDDATFSVVGHSLGGERALLSALFIVERRIRQLVAFEAPKCGNDALWARLAMSMTKAVCVCNGMDLWFGWPFISGWSHPPVAHVHLLESGWEMVGPGDWPAALDAGDHDIALVVERLGKIAGATPAGD